MENALFDAVQDEALRRQQANPLVNDGRKLIPAVEAVFARNGNLHIYLEAYDRDAVQTEPVVVFATFFDGDRKVLETPAYVVTEGWRAQSSAVPIRFTIPLDTLAPGDYTCQVTVLDVTSRKAAFWESEISVRP